MRVMRGKERGIVLYDLFKVVAAVIVIAALLYYWIVEGPLLRGKGRWRDVLSALNGQERADHSRKKAQEVSRMDETRDSRIRES